MSRPHHAGETVCHCCGGTHSRDGHRLCWHCRSNPLTAHPTVPPLQQVGHNAADLMASLPAHSHHRAPLVHYLSKGLDSTSAANILHCSASYVRQCKRKDYSESDLMQDKYARDVKRQKTDPGVLTQLCDFLASSCPTKSGDRSVTYHQYVSDDALYQAYATTCFPAVSFHTFYNIKQWMPVKHAGKYFGQFDCSTN